MYTSRGCGSLCFPLSDQADIGDGDSRLPRSGECRSGPLSLGSNEADGDQAATAANIIHLVVGQGADERITFEQYPRAFVQQFTTQVKQMCLNFLTGNRAMLCGVWDRGSQVSEDGCGMGSRFIPVFRRLIVVRASLVFLAKATLIDGAQENQGVEAGGGLVEYPWIWAAGVILQI